MIDNNNGITTPPPNAGTKVCKCCGRELPTTSFTRGGFGLLNTCNDCRAKKCSAAKKGKKVNELEDLRQQLEQARRLRLQEFKPRELMVELKRRGYEGNLTYTETHTIDLSKIE